MYPSSHRDSLEDSELCGHGAHPAVPPSLRPLRRTVALVEQVVERLREGILSGEFPADSLLPPEAKLAEMMGVSYTVIREAMRALRSQGLVEVHQGRRARIRPPDSEVVQESLETMLRRIDGSLRELAELRRPIEGEIAALAAKRATPQHVAAMEEAIQRQVIHQTLDQRIDADVEFHDLLARASGNRLFPLVLVSVMGLLRESCRRTITRVGIDYTVGGHRAVLDAIRSGDPQTARERMYEHVRMVAEDL